MSTSLALPQTVPFPDNCHHLKNITLERYKFFSRRQGTDETVESFVSALTNLSVSCELGNLRDVLVKDIMICGLADTFNFIKDAIIQEDPCSLEDAIEKIQKMLKRHRRKYVSCVDTTETNESKNGERDTEDECFSVSSGSVAVREEVGPDTVIFNEESDHEDIQEDSYLSSPLRGKRKTRMKHLPKEIKKSHQNTDKKDGYICKICGKTLAVSSFRRHMLSHSGERPHMCAQCGKRFIRKGTLDVHLSTHNTERPFTCDYCDKSFVNKLYLGIHIRAHTGIRPYQCQFCGKCFVQKGSLNAHVRKHTGETPYRCDKCEKAFKYKEDLNSHLLSHTGETPFICPECGKSFQRKSYLQIHRKNHSEDRPFKCNQCGKCFKIRKHLRRHSALHCDKTRIDNNDDVS